MEATITISGNLGTDVDYRQVGDQHSLATFRIGSTRSHYRNGTWHDAPTVWLTVQCWRQLAENVAASLRKGDPVFVTGRLKCETWTTSDGEPRSKLVIDATGIGHDLNAGVATFKRNEKTSVSAAERDELARQALADEDAGQLGEAIEREEAA